MQCLWWPEEGVSFLGAGVTGRNDLFNMAAGNQCPPEKAITQGRAALLFQPGMGIEGKTGGEVTLLNYGATSPAVVALVSAEKNKTKNQNNRMPSY